MKWHKSYSSYNSDVKVVFVIMNTPGFLIAYTVRLSYGIYVNLFQSINIVSCYNSVFVPAIHKLVLLMIHLHVLYSVDIVKEGFGFKRERYKQYCKALPIRTFSLTDLNASIDESVVEIRFVHKIVELRNMLPLCISCMLLFNLLFI